LAKDEPESKASNERMSRRQYIKYAGAGVAAIGAATTTALFGLPMVDPYAFDRPPTADFEYKPYYSDPRYPIDPTYASPTSGYTIQFLDRSTDPDNENNTQSQIKKLLGYRIPQPLSYSWYVDDTLKASARDFSTKLPADSFETAHMVRLSVTDGRQLSSKERVLLVDPDQLYAVSRLNAKVKGVVYWVDCAGPHSNQEYAESDMNLIRDELGCNGIRIVAGSCGLSADEAEKLVVQCARAAIHADFENVSICARYMNATLEETKERVKAFAKRAAELADVSDAIVFQLGNELSIDARGVCSSPTYEQRAGEIERNVDNPAYQEKLVTLLEDLVSVSRESYDGKLSYAAHPGEWAIPWDELDFDIVGQNQYWWPECTDEKFVEIFMRLGKFVRPVHITEFGCGTYLGAFDVGGAAYRHGARTTKRHRQRA
jgi:hypothetical protein